MNKAQMYLKMLALCGRETVDCHYHAAFYLLSGFGDIAEKAYRFISPDGIDFDGMLRQVYSTHQWHLVKVAYSLYSMSDAGIPIYELAHFPHRDYELVQDAMFITNGQYKVYVTGSGGQAEIRLDKSGFFKVKEFNSQLDELYAQCDQAYGKVEEA